MARHAFIRVSTHLLKEMLHMPTGTLVGHAVEDPDASVTNPAILLYIAHPELPDVPDGEPVPTVEPWVTHQREEYIWEWGDPVDSGRAETPWKSDQNGSEGATVRCKRCGGSPVVAEAEGRTLVCATCRDDAEFRAHAERDYR